MTKKELLKKFKAVLSAADKLKNENIPNEVFFREIEPLKAEFKRLLFMGAIHLCTKQTIFRAVQFQSSYRVCAEHTFYIYFLKP